ncbi:MAG: oligosaccharide flippase family protein, partial [Chloroflexota bacterium]|nr:oligosaccharide flippase family protein [Chloroflexota bacterium]
MLPIDEPLAEVPFGETEAQSLLKRTPRSYLLNQLYGLWFFISRFILSIIITRKLPTEQYGVYAVASVAFNTIAYIVALGLEDATTTYVPRIFAEYGRAAVALLLRRLLFVRTGILLASMLILLFGMPLLATLFASLPLPGASDTAKGLRDPALLAHITPIAFYVLGNGISSLFTSACAALMRMRPVFVIGSIVQVVLLGAAFLLLQLGWGVDGILWLQGILSLLGSVAFALWLIPLLSTQGAIYKQPLRPVIHLGVNAWLTQLVSGALLKQTAIILLGYFAISIVQIGYFNLSFQLGHAASLLLVTGFGGVAGSALAAAFIGKNYDRLARTWQALIKIETLLAAPILIFCLFNAQVLAHTLYGSNYDPVGPLLAIFLFFNLLARALGTTISQYVLYVLGKAHLAVFSQWAGLVALIVLGILFIPSMGPAGALIADGLSQLITGGLMLLFLWRPLPRKYPLDFTLRLVLGLM